MTTVGVRPVRSPVVLGHRSFPDYLFVFGCYLQCVIRNFQEDASALYNNDRITILMCRVLFHFQSTIFSKIINITNLTNDFYFIFQVTLLVLFFPTIINRMTWSFAINRLWRAYSDYCYYSFGTFSIMARFKT